MRDSDIRDVCDFLDPDTATDLLSGALPADRRDEVIRHLRHCGECENRFRKLTAHQERLRSAGPPVPHRTTSLRSRRWIGVMAAAAALTLLLYWPHDEPDSGLAAVILPSYSATILIRAQDTDSMRIRLVDGLEAYSRREFDLAADLLAAVEADGTEAAVRNSYLGSALVLTGRDAEALGVLNDETIDAIPDPWGNESRWALCGVLHRLGHRTRADSILQVLATEPGTVGDRARLYLGSGNDAVR